MNVAATPGEGPARYSLVAHDAASGRAVRVTIDNGRVASLERASPEDAGVLWISPGWIDIQVNGYRGHDPNASAAGPEATVAMVRELWADGITGVCVTLCTEAEPHILARLRAIADACASDPLVASSIVGIHIEGPHISREDGPRGVHPLAHVRPPDVDEYRRWQDAARGRIRIITLSPEHDGACDYVRRIRADGVVAAIGHTAATSEQIRAAVDAGARLSTHLGNGAHSMLRRHPNYIWDQLAEDRLSASLIFDGHHLPPSVMRVLVRAKGVERCILVSDAAAPAGLRAGRYRFGDGAEVELLPSGRLELVGTPYLAGSATALRVCIANAVRDAGVPLADAVRMVTVNPSRLLNLRADDGHESLKEGMRANLTVFRLDALSGDLDVVHAIVEGRLVHSSAPVRP
jgi:N-acetylglucosamine-6-phosphate deacetylase